MNGYSSHNLLVDEREGRPLLVQYHFKTVQGIENFSLAEANAMVSEDPDFLRRDLWDAIAAGEAPEWRLEMQIMPFEEAADYRFNPFDLTKVWPHADYPPITIGVWCSTAIRRTTSRRSTRPVSLLRGSCRESG